MFPDASQVIQKFLDLFYEWSPQVILIDNFKETKYVLCSL